MPERLDRTKNIPWVRGPRPMGSKKEPIDTQPGITAAAEGRELGVTAALGRRGRC